MSILFSPGTKAEEIRAYLLSEHSEGRKASALKTALQFDCSRAYVHRLRNELKRAGAFSTSGAIAFGPNGGHNPTGYNGSNPAAKLSRVSSSFPTSEAGAMSPSERKLFLSDLARFTDREEIKVSAISALNRLEASLRTEEQRVRAPLTPEEAAARFTRLERAFNELFRQPSAGEPEPVS